MLKYIWQAPQLILGAIIKAVSRAEFMCVYNDAKLYKWHHKGGLSLGKYIFVPADCDISYINHEYGHTKQSKMLGWLYLIVIGLPSLIWAGCFEGYRKRKGVSYYAFYTERWADKLGGVDRDAG